MKKVLVVLAGFMAIMVMTGCVDATKETKKVSGVEEIHIEEIHVEEIQVESILTERIYIDDEYENEVNYNSKINTWDTVSNTWDRVSNTF